jgi:hypothetical protein
MSVAALETGSAPVSMGALEAVIAALLRAEPGENIRRIAEQDRIRSIPLANFHAWCEVQVKLREQVTGPLLSLGADDRSRKISEAIPKVNETIARLARHEMEARP